MTLALRQLNHIHKKGHKAFLSFCSLTLDLSSLGVNQKTLVLLVVTMKLYKGFSSAILRCICGRTDFFINNIIQRDTFNLKVTINQINIINEYSFNDTRHILLIGLLQRSWLQWWMVNKLWWFHCFINCSGTFLEILISVSKLRSKYIF